jgi:phosphomevalonate kinase
MKKFAVSGKKCVGKSLFEAIFLKIAGEMGLVVRVVRCADETKAQFLRERGLPMNYLDIRENKEHVRDALSRFALKRYQTERNLFLQPLVDAVSNTDDNTVILIPDVRMRCQLNVLTDCVRIRITSTDENRWNRGWTPTPDDLSIFETDLDDDDVTWDYVIQNDGSIEDFERAIRQILINYHGGV